MSKYTLTQITDEHNRIKYVIQDAETVATMAIVHDFEVANLTVEMLNSDSPMKDIAVHHIDGDVTNNDLVNLRIVSIRENSRNS